MCNLYNMIGLESGSGKMTCLRPDSDPQLWIEQNLGCLLTFFSFLGNRVFFGQQQKQQSSKPTNILKITKRKQFVKCRVLPSQVPKVQVMCHPDLCDMR